MLRSLIGFLLLAVMANPLAAPGPSPNPFDPFTLLEVHPIPTKVPSAIEPVITAKAALVMEADSGTLLYSKDAYSPMPIASLTKIMTGVLILDHHDLDEIVTIQTSYADVPGVKIGLQKNEQITVGNLLIGLLVRSGGDAALALAQYHSNSIEAFVQAMNQKANELHLLNTHFKNPIGLDEEGHFASAYDLAILTKYALRNAYFRRVVQMPEAEITSVDGQISHAFKNTNQLLGSYLDILGVKTGTTDEAGASVINLARHPKGYQIISIILNSPSRFQENKSLIDWAFRNFYW